MKYAKELAPNLFNRFRDWYLNYISETGTEPSDNELQQAVTYYENFKKEQKDGQSA